MGNLETTILRNLLHNDQFMRKAIPFIKSEYFDTEHKYLFNQIVKFVGKYNKLPNREALEIEIGNDEKLSTDLGNVVAELIVELDQKENPDEQWLLDSTEKWCQDRAIYLAIMESIQIIDGKSKQYTSGAIPDLLKSALGVCFDTNVGHDYLGDVDGRYEFYHKDEARLPFDLEFFNKITKGGVPDKTLNVILAGTGVGKSLFMCHCAAANLMDMKNVLYITMEMAEERIAERIDANLMNVTVDELKDLPKQIFEKKIHKIHDRTQGKLIIKEYPTGAAHVGHFRALLNELELKRNFKPDVIYIDYLNICSSSRMKGLGGSVNTYSLIKSIAEEVRGLAVEFDVPIFTATQTTRSGYGNSDVGLEDTSESFGLPATADLMFALISNEELEKLNQIMVKQLKNRYNDPGMNKRFVIGVDRARMKLYDTEQTAQTDLVQDDIPDKPINSFGTRESNFGDFKL